MVAYSFKARFAEPILAGTKGGTIRADRRRHARQGEEMQLYTGMRTKQCRLIARKTCLDIEQIWLWFGMKPALRLGSLHFSNVQDLDEFATFDGFTNWMELEQFWRDVHESTWDFEGWHIRWLPLPWTVGEPPR